MAASQRCPQAWRTYYSVRPGLCGLTHFWSGIESVLSRCASILSLLFFLQDKSSIHVYSVNGRLLSSSSLDEQVTAMHLVLEHVILGTSQGSLHIRSLHRYNAPQLLLNASAAPTSALCSCNSLEAPVMPLALKVPVRSVFVTKECSHILVGLEDGKLIVVGAGKPEEVRVRPCCVCVCVLKPPADSGVFLVSGPFRTVLPAPVGLHTPHLSGVGR